MQTWFSNTKGEDEVSICILLRAGMENTSKSITRFLIAYSQNHLEECRVGPKRKHRRRSRATEEMEEVRLKHPMYDKFPFIDYVLGWVKFGPSLFFCYFRIRIGVGPNSAM